jgi:single-stranded DNA-binding protein
MEKFKSHELKIFSGFMSEPDINYFESGNNKTKFSIPLKHKKDDEPLWLNCIAWGAASEHIAENFKKGSFVTVIGKFQIDEYQGKEYLNFNVSKAF